MPSGTADCGQLGLRCGDPAADFRRRDVVDELIEVRDRVRAERLGVLADQVLARRGVDAERDDLTVVGGDDMAVLPDDLREPLRDQLA